MKPAIESRFTSNLERVQNLIDLFKDAKPDVRGRPATLYADVLRASVVFLHAALEDLLRSLEEWKLPATLSTDATLLEELVNKGRHRLLIDGKDKLSLADLAKHRGKSVDVLIEQGVNAYLRDMSYNDVHQVCGSLKRSAIRTAVVDPHAKELETMMKRRHWIAHRADRNPMRGRGHHRTQPIELATVEAWLDVVRSFGRDLLSNVQG